MKRRTFIKTASLAGAATLVSREALAKSAASRSKGAMAPAKGPVIIATWDFGKPAVETAYQTLMKGGTVIDAVERGVMIPEADPKNTSVGYGGYPDRDGNVTLDACIMNGNGDCGSVVFLEHIMHPVSVARLVMEKTQHVVLAGDGALQFALENGFKKEDLLTPEVSYIVP